MYRLMTIVFSLLRMALKLDNSTFQSVDRGAGMAAGLASHQKAGEQGSRRAAEMSGDGVAWGVWDPSESSLELSGSHLVTIPGIQNKTSYGPLRLQLGEEQLTIFDYGMHLGERQRVLAPILQTVGSYRIVGLQAPQFYSRPVAHNGAVYSNFLTCFQPVDSMTAHSFNQTIESMSPNRVVGLLDTKTAFTELLPLLQERGLTVEWTGDNLLVYRLGETIDREEIQSFAKEVVQIGEFVRAANAEAAAECAAATV